MKELKRSDPDFNTNMLLKTLKIFDPYLSQSQNQKIVLFGKNAREGNPISSSTAQDTYLSKNEDKLLKSTPFKDNSSSINMETYKRIVIDLQKEFDEDQELLDLLQPQKNPNPTQSQSQNQSDQKKTGIKALFELKQSKIDMIPEEDEEKLKQDQRIMNYKEKEDKKKEGNNSNTNVIPNRCYHRKRQIDIFSNQDNNNYSNNCNSRKNNQHQQQLSTNNDNNNYKLNSENERKGNCGLLSPPSRIDCNGCLITNEKNNESSSTTGITHDSVKKYINYNSHNIDTKNIKPIKYGYLTQKMDLIKTQQIPVSNSNCLPPRKNSRPLSNPHISSHNLKKEEDNPILNQNIERVINDLMNKREISGHNDKKRTQLGSAPAHLGNLNEKLFKNNYKQKEYFSNSNININNLRQMHKIKIERGLASSKLLEKFSKQLSYDYSNDFNKNKRSPQKHNSNHHHNEPIKIIKM